MGRRKAQTPLSAQSIADLAKSFNEQIEERGGALLACAWVDDSLGEYIRYRCVNDSKRLDALLGTRGTLEFFSARIDVAFAFGIIDGEMRDDLTVLREIRNDFAHARDPITFSDVSISAKCRTLNAAKLIEAATSVPMADKDRYVTAALVIAATFMSAKEQRPTAMKPVTTRAVAGSGFSVELVASAMGISAAIRRAFVPMPTPKPAS